MKMCQMTLYQSIRKEREMREGKCQILWCDKDAEYWVAVLDHGDLVGYELCGDCILDVLCRYSDIKEVGRLLESVETA